ncbi:MAG: hypothetical protein ACE366_21465 [Bradymonadia bacterium]
MQRPFSHTAAVTLLLFGQMGCGATLRYPHDTPERMVQSWQDAFNRDEQQQLRLMVHPDQRETFDQYAKDVEAQLDRYTMVKFAVGDPVALDGGRVGRSVTFYLADERAEAGAEPVDNDSVILKSDGRWWLWTY